MKPYTHLYCIPTNRPVEQSFRSFIPEITEAIESGLLLEDDILFAVIDDGDALCNEINRTFMMSYFAESNIASLHISNDMRGQLVQHCCGDDTSLLALFNSEGTNYGAIANVCSLLGAAVGAEYIHRRDSDTLLFSSEEGLVSPLMVELKAIAENEHSVIIGSNYFCNSDVDVRIFSESESLEKELYYMLGNTDESLSEKMALSSEPSFCKPTWEPIPPEGMWPDMGNICFGSLYKEVPFPPHPETLGSDYFLTAVASFSGKSMVLHNQRVIHEYQEERSTTAYLCRYYANLARYIDYNEYYFPLLEALEGSESCADALKKSLTELTELQSNRTARSTVLDSFIVLFTKLETAQSVAIAEAIEAQREQILDQSELWARKHLQLLEQWPAMMARAETYEPLPVKVEA